MPLGLTEDLLLELLAGVAAYLTMFCPTTQRERERGKQSAFRLDSLLFSSRTFSSGGVRVRSFDPDPDLDPDPDPDRPFTQKKRGGGYARSFLPDQPPFPSWLLDKV